MAGGKDYRLRIGAVDKAWGRVYRPPGSVVTLGLGDQLRMRAALRTGRLPVCMEIVPGLEEIDDDARARAGLIDTYTICEYRGEFDAVDGLSQDAAKAMESMRATKKLADWTRWVRERGKASATVAKKAAEVLYAARVSYPVRLSAQEIAEMGFAPKARDAVLVAAGHAALKTSEASA